ncbi:hypothetical protein FDA94_28675 [Herbidospora galbida]|uniref:Uncharacterized protein n=1 Tax=Herbidospora galbida TaxID=2575442 RepID=A0A4U3MAK9_9ACTN|nr:hypothetical protein [Herbidospora galbida]TKK84606.1 hypothetical protein FDA94_28675 [Herbidospora galbida]
MTNKVKKLALFYIWDWKRRGFWLCPTIYAEAIADAKLMVELYGDTEAVNRRLREMKTYTI